MRDWMRVEQATRMHTSGTLSRAGNRRAEADLAELAALARQPYSA